MDKCPDTPRGAKVDAAGCTLPEPKPPLFEGKKELVLEGVNFASDKWDITEESKAVLNPVAVSLKDWPNVKIEVDGHTDSTNTDKHNMILSQKRAESVMSYLIGQGVPASQMTAKGFGESQPVADNKTKEGRAKNRRVVLQKVE